MIINTGGNGGVTAEAIKYDDTTVAQALNTLEDELTANGTRIYLDYKGGQYGYNTDALRGADTFSPFKSGLEPVLLWTNPKPNVQFVKQTILLDFSKYEAIVIKAKGWIDGSEVMSSMCYMPIPCVSSPLTTTYNNNTNGASRMVTVTASSIYFDWAVYSNGVEERTCIPLQIYGIKTDFMK